MNASPMKRPRAWVPLAASRAAPAALVVAAQLAAVALAAAPVLLLGL
jgi:hypothetical protein